jgi:hypothetical protein
MNASAREYNPQRVNIHASLRMSCATLRQRREPGRGYPTSACDGAEENRRASRLFDRLQFPGPCQAPRTKTITGIVVTAPAAQLRAAQWVRRRLRRVLPESMDAVRTGREPKCPLIQRIKVMTIDRVFHCDIQCRAAVGPVQHIPACDDLIDDCRVEGIDRRA